MFGLQRCRGAVDLLIASPNTW